jgi:hypothetical protein
MFHQLPKGESAAADLLPFCPPLKSSAFQGALLRH